MPGPGGGAGPEGCLVPGGCLVRRVPSPGGCTGPRGVWSGGKVDFDDKLNFIHKRQRQFFIMMTTLSLYQYNPNITLTTLSS